MQRLSSDVTLFYKWAFPFIWFGFLALLFVASLLSPMLVRETTGSLLPFLLVLAFMAAVGYLITKLMNLDLVDEVLDAGDALVVRNGKVEDRIALTEIIKVSCTQFSNPPRATLTLRNPSRLGDRIIFYPATATPFVRLPFSTNPVIEGLIKRVEAARASAR